MAHQIVVFAVLGLALILFVWGRWRYDLVALFALLAIASAGILDSGEVFAGFGHPAVITVAAVLVVSRGLSNAEVVDSIPEPTPSDGDMQQKTGYSYRLCRWEHVGLSGCRRDTLNGCADAE